MTKMLSHAYNDISTTESIWDGLLHNVLIDAIIETILIVPFLFLAYLIMELIEHKASDKTLAFLKRSGKAGPAVGALLGTAPQCAFSAVAANLYTGRVISLGTLLAVFLSTSDEMLLIMISEGAAWQGILISLGYKLAVGLTAGFVIDAAIHLFGNSDEHLHIDGMCEADGCHCENGAIRSAIHHTVTITALIFIVTIATNSLVFFIGAERIGTVMSSIPVISHLMAALVGLIPGCATSVALTSLCMDGIISGGVMMSGLFSGAGVGMLVLLKVNKSWRENIKIMAILAAVGLIFGLAFDLTGLSSFIHQ